MPKDGCWLVLLLARLADELKIDRNKLLGAAFDIAEDMAREGERYCVGE